MYLALYVSPCDPPFWLRHFNIPFILNEKQKKSEEKKTKAQKERNMFAKANHLLLLP
jgi:hypothetical protein